MTTTTENVALMKTFAIGEKVWWVSPHGYKELVTVSGCVEQGSPKLIVQSMYGLMMDFVVHDGRLVGLEHWGHLEKQETTQVPEQTSLWTRIRKHFQ